MIAKQYNCRVFRYTRGTEFSVEVCFEKDTVSFYNLNVPDDVESDVLLKFYDDAEMAALLELDKEEGV